jgi:hypothetical protein
MVFLKRVGEDQDVIEIYRDNAFGDQVLEDLILGTTMDASGCIWINIYGLSTSSTKLISKLFAGKGKFSVSMHFWILPREIGCH